MEIILFRRFHPPFFLKCEKKTEVLYAHYTIGPHNKYLYRQASDIFVGGRSIDVSGFLLHIRDNYLGLSVMLFALEVRVELSGVKMGK